MDNSDLLKRIEKLEKQVELLQSEISVIKNIEVSEKARELIGKMEYANKLADLMEAISGEKLLDSGASDELKTLQNIAQQAEMEIQESVNDIDAFIKAAADDSVFEYQPYKDGVEITQYNGMNKAAVIVPERLNGLPVRKIGAKFFRKCQEIKHIKLPETLLELGDYCFFWL